MQVGVMLERVALGLGNFDELLKFNGYQHSNCGCKLNLRFAAPVGEHRALWTHGPGATASMLSLCVSPDSLCFPSFFGEIFPYCPPPGTQQGPEPRQGVQLGWLSRAGSFVPACGDHCDLRNTQVRPSNQDPREEACIPSGWHGTFASLLK